MDRISLKAKEREVFGKKVKYLRREGLIPAHVFGKKLDTEHVTVDSTDFTKVFKEAGETGLVDLKIGAEKVRPVLIREVQTDPVLGHPLHIDFYQVNLTEKTTVPVPIVLLEAELELVHTGEAVVIQPLMEVEVEALPTDLPENIEVDISSLKAIGDAITVKDLKVPAGVTILAEEEAVVAKLDNAVTEEMQALLEEQAEEQAAVAEAAEAESAGGETSPEGGEAVEGEEGEKTEESAGGETSPEASEQKPESTEEKPAE